MVAQSKFRKIGAFAVALDGHVRTHLVSDDPMVFRFDGELPARRDAHHAVGRRRRASIRIAAPRSPPVWILLAVRLALTWSAAWRIAPRRIPSGRVSTRRILAGILSWVLG